jgi:seryl-tRNA synthetase
MLDIKKIREQPEETREALRRRGDFDALVDAVLDLDRRRRSAQAAADELKTRRNSLSKEIGARRKRGEDTEAGQAEVRAIGGRIAELDRTSAEVESELRDTLLRIPNLPHPSIPTGPRRLLQPRGPRRRRGTHLRFRAARPHRPRRSARLFDFPRGVKIAGTGFPHPPRAREPGSSAR